MTGEEEVAIERIARSESGERIVERDHLFGRSERDHIHRHDPDEDQERICLQRENEGAGVCDKRIDAEKDPAIDQREDDRGGIASGEEIEKWIGKNNAGAGLVVGEICGVENQRSHENQHRNERFDPDASAAPCQPPCFRRCSLGWSIQALLSVLDALQLSFET
jgi:hypothetical protein